MKALKGLYDNVVAIVIYLAMSAIELVVSFGPIVGPILLVVWLSNLFGWETGGGQVIAAICIAVAVGLGWYYFLMHRGGQKKIADSFRRYTHSVIRALGAGGALSE